MVEKGWVVLTSTTLLACMLLYPQHGNAVELKPQEMFRPPTDSAQAETPEAMGDLYLIHQQYMQAIEEYYKEPDNSAQLWNKIGVAYHHMFAMGQAKKSYQHALKLNSDYPPALNNLGAVYFSEKNYKKAIKLYRHALKLTPDAAVTYSNLGTAYFAMKKVQPGIEAYRQALMLDPSVFNHNSSNMITEGSDLQEMAREDYCLAELFAQAGMQSRAIEYLRRAFGRGFNDRNRLKQDPFFSSLRKTPEFARLMAEEKIR